MKYRLNIAVIIILLSSLLTSCANQSIAVSTAAVASVQDIPESTPYPTQTFYPTFTSLPTHTTYPTQTPKVVMVTSTLTQTPEPTATPTMTATPVQVVGVTFECGDVFEVKLLDDPRLVKALYFEHANGIFVIFLMEMINITSETIDGIMIDSFELHANLSGKPVIFTPNTLASYYASSIWNWQDYTDSYQPSTSTKIPVTFDINPAGSDWVLRVKPNEFLGDTLCEVDIPISIDFSKAK